MPRDWGFAAGGPARHTRRMRRLLAIGCGALLAGSCLPDRAVADAGPLPPGRLVDYRSLAFQPEVWEQQRVSTLLLPWTGSNVVFLTTNGTYDAVLMSHWVRRVDQAWALYADLTGARPRPFKQLELAGRGQRRGAEGSVTPFRGGLAAAVERGDAEGTGGSGLVGAGGVSPGDSGSHPAALGGGAVMLRT